MIASDDSARHEEAWVSLPWLANGRLSQAERDKIEPHVRTCAACREELAFQRLLCNVLTEPDRVTYAPGPSFRKLMDRIDGAAPPARESREHNKAPAAPARRRINSTAPCGVRPDSRGRRASSLPLASVESPPRSIDRRSRCIRRTLTTCIPLRTFCTSPSTARSRSVKRKKCCVRAALVSSRDRTAPECLESRRQTSLPGR
jgi:hypothetical protein